MLTKQQIYDLPKGFHPSGVENRRARRDNREALDHNNRKGLSRVRVIQAPGQRATKLTVRKQIIGKKTVYHYE